jgi:hypothetical protein
MQIYGKDGTTTTMEAFTRLHDEYFRDKYGQQPIQDGLAIDIGVH